MCRWSHVGAGGEGRSRAARSSPGGCECRASPRYPTPELRGGVKTADVELGFWYGIFGPKGMPDAVKAKLEQAVATVTADARVRERMAKLDITPSFAPSAVLRTKLDTEIRNWTRFIDAKGIKPE